jgi:hypothetical protein
MPAPGKVLQKPSEITTFSVQPKSTNMKKWIIGSLVGAILIFCWQFLSWEVLGLHNGGFKYTSAQDSIRDVLSSSLKEDGGYFIPNVPPGSDKKAKMDLMKQNEGKPWAWVIYHQRMEDNMIKQIIRGFLIDFVLVLLLVIILTKGGLPGAMGVLTGTVAIGVITFLWGPYTGHNWFATPWAVISGDIIDAIVPWALCGFWLGWWLNKK